MTKVVPIEERRRLATDLAEKYKAGSSIRQLAAETGYSYGFVHSVLKARVRFRTRGGDTRRPKGAK